MKRMRFLSLVLILTMLVTALGVQFTFAQPNRPGDLEAVGLTPDSEVSPLDTKLDAVQRFSLASESIGSEEMVSVIVKLEDASLAAHTDVERLDLKSSESQTYLDYLEVKQDSFISVAEASLSDIHVTHRYDVILGGVAMLVPESQIDQLSKLPGVVAVYADELLQIDTDSSPDFIGATRLWKYVGGKQDAGEGVVVGVLDTGVWPEHPSFADPDPAGNPYPAPPGGPYDCNFGNTAWNPNDAPFTCNNKLIGAYEFMDTYKAVRGLSPDEFDSARDSDGHGSHTSSTAAGNASVEASILGTSFGTVDGIAPRAHIIMYRVCGGPRGSCYVSDSAAAVQQAILDGVDVLNFSIGGGTNPYSDAVSLAFLDAYEAGVFVACSAGNAGPGADTVGHREPWVTTVAASTQVRTFEGHIYLEADGGDTLDLVGVSIGGSITGNLVMGADYGDPLCGSVDGVNPFPPGTFTSDQIVVCERGIVARVEKSANVMNGGGGGVILYNPTVNTTNADNHFIPTVHIDDVTGVELLDFIATHTGLVATLTGGVKVDSQGDVMAAFSSRGGPAQSLGITKPDISAPGVNILAAQTPMLAFPFEGGGGAPDQLFQAIGGTSMASPHIAGAGALLTDLHPDWTPGQVKSALMTTAWVEGMVKEDGVTPADPFDYGSGRVNLKKAGFPGLTISATAQDFVDHEADLWNANYPSLYVPVMPGQITVERTVHNESRWSSWWRTYVDSPDDVDVSVPRWIRVPGNGDKTFSITVDARDVPLGEVRHATLYLKRGCKKLRFPITIVRNQPAVTLEKTCDPAVFLKGDTTDCTITIENTSYDEATVSLVDYIPRQLRLVNGSVAGADQLGSRKLSFDGTLYGAGAPEIVITEYSESTYLSMAAFASPIPPPSNPDDGGYLVGVDFYYNDQHYTDAIWSVNGTLQAGIGDGYATGGANTPLPFHDETDNLLAPWWTDLDMTSAGNWYYVGLTDGVNNYTVFEWENVPRFGDATSTATFQIWIVDGTDYIWFTYGGFTGNVSDATVGAENADGTIGTMFYWGDGGLGSVPSNDLDISSVPGTPGETHVITYTALGKRRGDWKNCAEMTGDLFFGTNIACFSGEVTKP